MNHTKLIFGGLALAVLSGCASIVSDNTQSIRVETTTADGQSIAGASCKLVNDRGMYDATSPATVLVRKSGENIDVTCTYIDSDEGTGTLISRAGGGMWGNILFGGGIGAIIDHNKGTAYNYPNWVKVVMGKALVFDRKNSKEDHPTPGFGTEDPTKVEETIQPSLDKTASIK